MFFFIRSGKPWTDQAHGKSGRLGTLLCVHTFFGCWGSGPGSAYSPASAMERIWESWLDLTTHPGLKRSSLPGLGVLALEPQGLAAQEARLLDCWL